MQLNEVGPFARFVGLSNFKIMEDPSGANLALWKLGADMAVLLETTSIYLISDINATSYSPPAGPVTVAFIRYFPNGITGNAIFFTSKDVKSMSDFKVNATTG